MRLIRLCFIECSSVYVKFDFFGKLSVLIIWFYPIYETSFLRCPDGSWFFVVLAVGKTVLVEHERSKPKQTKLINIYSFWCSKKTCANLQTSFSGRGSVSKKSCFFSAHCQQVPKTNHSWSEHWRYHCKQVVHYLALQLRHSPSYYRNSNKSCSKKLNVKMH